MNPKLSSTHSKTNHATLLGAIITGRSTLQSLSTCIFT